MANGCCTTLAIAPGIQLGVSEFTAEETARFYNDFQVVGNIFSRYSNDPLARHAIRDLLDKYREQFLLFAQAAKNDIEGAGAFQGINAQNGYGMRIPRPEDLVECTKHGARTFDGTSNAVANAWSGLWHDGAISAAYGANPLYMRKELCVAICGFVETDPNLLASPAEEVQWEINGKPLPVWNMVQAMKVGDLKIYEAPQVIYLQARKTYRVQYKTGNTLTSTPFSLQPIGITFVTADIMRNITPPHNTTTPP